MYEAYHKQKLLEYAAANTEELLLTNSITFVKLAESGVIDEVTAGEHMNLFTEWQENLNYHIKDICRYNENLYQCLQAHTSQFGWEPDKAPSLWKKISDPTVEYPEWSQPISAADAYQVNDKVSHNDKHWISEVNNNVWEPGVYGWTESIK